MNAVLLITFTLALVHGYNPYNAGPCKENADTNHANNNFAHKHILRGPVPESRVQWRSYLNQNGLCNRQQQTFIQQTDKNLVERICNGDGKHMPHRNKRNLCISNETFWVYEVRVSSRRNRCRRIDKVVRKQRHVIVACDLIDNQCRPVQFEGLGRSANYRGQTCRP